MFVESFGVRLGSVDGAMCKGGNAFVCRAKCDRVSRARCSNQGLIIGVVKGVFEFVEGMLRKVGFLSENEVMVEGEELVEMGINRANVGGGDG